MKHWLSRIVCTNNRSKVNLFSGLSYQFISVCMGLVLPHLFIVNLGSESNGLISSIGQIYVCLGLLEAGVSTTTIQALYKPVANNDHTSINAILAATHKYYRKAGLWYAIGIVVLTIVYPRFVDSALPDTTIRRVIALQGMGAVVSFLFQSKYTLLLRAEGKNYIQTLLSLLLLIVRNAGKIIAIQLGYDIVTVQAIHFVTIIIEAFVILFYIKHHYPWLTVKGKPDFDSISQKGSVFVQYVAWTVFNHTDILVLTIITRNLALVSVYSVYSLVFDAAQNIMNEIRSAFQYKIGYKAQQGSVQLDEYFSKYNPIVISLTFIVFSAVYLITKPFIILYTQGITDINYLVGGVAELFFTLKVLYGLRALNKQVIDANGHFKQTRRIPIIEAISNIGVSILLVFYFGLCGVLIGTVCSLLIGFALYVHYIMNNVAPKAMKAQLGLIMISFPIVLATIFLENYMHYMPTSWWQFVVFSLIVAVSSAVSYALVYLFFYRIQHRYGR
ncbi:MAG: polysaccharide biosynthesis protein [Clostridia bacterium]|nr:polysaccharide biosynthesis protein [Clostridia bacterium]